MKLAGSFKTKEELFQTLEEAISQDEQSRFYLHELREEQNRLAQTLADAQRSQQRAEEAEKIARELQSRLHHQPSVFEDSQRFRSHEFDEKLKQFTLDRVTFEAEKEQLKQKLEGLHQENEQYRRADQRRTICQSLREAAKRVGIRSEALRDVERLADQFQLHEDGTIRNANGADIDTILKEEKTLSPHWLPPSQGGGSRSGDVQVFSTSSYSQAKRSGDIETMILNAPIVE